MKGRSVERVVGADIGGANLKYSSVQGRAHARSFALWRHTDQLSHAIQEDLARFPSIDSLAVTMTGELADCFVDRATGVRHIVQATKQAADKLGIDRVLFYGVDGLLYSADDAVARVDMIASANWHALANYAGREIFSNGILVDVGSTTSDIIEIRDGAVATNARSDYDRLSEGSLVYVGCRRTPVCALVDHLSLDGHKTPVMNELFATIDDASLLLAKQSERPTDTDTADGKPRTCQFAANRIARMIGLDRRQVTVEQSRQLAAQIYDAARRRISAAIDHFTTAGDPVLLCGHGQDLIDLPAVTTVRQLSSELGAEVSRCAPAFAVAQLCVASELRSVKVS